MCAARLSRCLQGMADTSSEDEDVNENIEQAKENAGKAFEQPDMYDLQRVIDALPADVAGGAAASGSQGTKEPFWYFSTCAFVVVSALAVAFRPALRLHIRLQSRR